MTVARPRNGKRLSASIRLKSQGRREVRRPLPQAGSSFGAQRSGHILPLGGKARPGAAALDYRPMAHGMDLARDLGNLPGQRFAPSSYAGARGAGPGQAMGQELGRTKVARGREMARTDEGKSLKKKRGSFCRSPMAAISPPRVHSLLEYEGAATRDHEKQQTVVVVGSKKRAHTIYV